MKAVVEQTHRLMCGLKKGRVFIQSEEEVIWIDAEDINGLIKALLLCSGEENGES